MEPSGFSKLLTRKVPHIHEKVLLSLDYETFKNCREVCKTWDELMASESFCKKAYSAYKKEMDSELFICSREGNIDQLKSLLSSGVNPNCHQGIITPLIWSIMNSHIDAVKILLDHGAKPNGIDEHETPPLMWSMFSAENALKDIVILLLEQGADPKRATNTGTTPLHSAALNGYVGVVKELLDRGGYTDVPDRAGKTPLWLATVMGHDEVVKLIKKAGATNS